MKIPLLNQEGSSLRLVFEESSDTEHESYPSLLFAPNGKGPLLYHIDMTKDSATELHDQISGWLDHLDDEKWRKEHPGEELPHDNSGAYTGTLTPHPEQVDDPSPPTPHVPEGDWLEHSKQPNRGSKRLSQDGTEKVIAPQTPEPQHSGKSQKKHR